MSGGVPVSIGITPESISTTGGAATLFVTLVHAPSSQAEDVPVKFVQFPNASGDDLITNPDEQNVTIQKGRNTGTLPVYPRSGTDGGEVVIIAGDGDGVKSITLSIT